MKKKIFLICFSVLFFFNSCRDENSTPSPSNIFNWVGSWKPIQYEYKGKVFALESCQKQGKILINNDMSGTYINYIYSGGSCNMLENLSGTWSYDSTSLTLRLSYVESGVSKTKNFMVSSISGNELKLEDYTRDVDGVSGIDDAVLVYTKL